MGKLRKIKVERSEDPDRSIGDKSKKSNEVKTPIKASGTKGSWQKAKYDKR